MGYYFYKLLWRVNLLNMENLNTEEKDLVLDALNNYWHNANTELQKKELGDIERKNWEGIKTKAGELMRKLGGF